MWVQRFLFAAFLALAPLSKTPAEDWPEFRGPTGQGLSASKNLPTSWSKSENVRWKTALPGTGWSSPIVLEGRVFLTSAVPIDGSSKDLSLQALCLDTERGAILWTTDVFRQDGAKAPGVHSKNSHASPTPLTDGKRVYVHFGHQGTACLDLTGQVLWRNTDLRYAPVHGNGGSPILVGDLLLFAADGSDKQFLVALDKFTGTVVWKTDRASDAPKRFSFGTPLLIEVAGRPQVISPASNMVQAFDPADGKELWRVRYTGYSVIPRPVFGHGLVFFSSGYDRPTLYAIRPDGSGDVTKTHVAWTVSKGAPHTPSPLLVGDELYVVSDNGLASCLDARTGKAHWQERVGTAYSASPVHADGLIYLQDEEGATTVVRASTRFERVAQSTLNEPTLASYAIAGSAIYLRTKGHLYRLQAD